MFVLCYILNHLQKCYCLQSWVISLCFLNENIINNIFSTRVVYLFSLDKNVIVDGKILILKGCIFIQIYDVSVIQLVEKQYKTRKLSIGSSNSVLFAFTYSSQTDNLCFV